MFNVEQANAFTLCFSSDGEDIQAQSPRALDSALIPASSGADSDPTSSKRSGGETGVCAHHCPSLYAHSWHLHINHAYQDSSIHEPSLAEQVVLLLLHESNCPDNPALCTCKLFIHPLNLYYAMHTRSL